MKTIILILVSAIGLFAHALQYTHDFNKALQKAGNQHKNVMMIYSATWCPECNYMKEVVFKDQKVVDYIEKHFVVLSLNIQKDRLPKGFDYPGIPTFFILDQHGRERGKIIGGSKAGKFLQKLKAIK